MIVATVFLILFSGGAVFCYNFGQNCPQIMKERKTITRRAFLKILPLVASPVITKYWSTEEDVGEIIEGPEREKEITVLLTGDVMLGRTVMLNSRGEANFNYPFDKTGEVLKAADLVLVNLESPISESCPDLSEGFLLCSKPEMIGGLVYSGVDVASMANNHAHNLGEEGIEETKKLLNQNGIEVTGLGSLLIKEIKGVKFGILGFDFTSKKPVDSDYELIGMSKDKSDILIVGVHWGTEYTSEPNEYQRTWAAKLIKAGADVIVGHHPHWVQTVEFIDAKPVYYSLGNFVFDQMWSEKTKKGMVVKLAFNGAKLIKEERIPIYMSLWAQPEFVGDK